MGLSDKLNNTYLVFMPGAACVIISKSCNMSLTNEYLHTGFNK